MKRYFVVHSHINKLFEIGDRVTVFKDGKPVAAKDTKGDAFDDLVQLVIGQRERKRYKKTSLGEELILFRSVAENAILAWFNTLVKRFLPARPVNVVTRDELASKVDEEMMRRTSR
jgi:ABC-type sugar transport system ATPase subunit